MKSDTRLDTFVRSVLSGRNRSLRSSRYHFRLSFRRIATVGSVVSLGFSGGEGYQYQRDEHREQGDPSNDDEREDWSVVFVGKTETTRGN